MGWIRISGVKIGGLSEESILLGLEITLAEFSHEIWLMVKDAHQRQNDVDPSSLKGMLKWQKKIERWTWDTTM